MTDKIKVIVNPSPNWGGARPGGGRKPSGRTKRSIHLNDAEYAEVMELVNTLRAAGKKKGKE